MKNPLIFTLFFVLTLIFGIIPSIHASPAVNITVATDEQAYNPGEVVLIYGNLTSDETLVTDSLVGLQVQDPRNNLLIIRTLTTGAISSTTPFVEARSVVPCDSEGAPKESFKRGTLAYFKITVTNYGIQPRLALMTINTYDPNNIPFCSASIKTTLDGQATSTFIISIPIPTDATTGNATAYANAYTDWPKLEGTPYCPEVSAAFQIADGGSQATTPTTQSQPATTPQTNGNYNTTFQLAPLAKAGNYTIYTTSRYLGEETFSNTTFNVILLGDVDGNGAVDIYDALLLRAGFGSKPGDPNWNPNADLNSNNIIDIYDALIFRSQYLGQ